MAAERGAFVSGPHTSSSPLQMLPEPMHYGWTRDPSNIEAGGEDKGSPSGAVRAPVLPGQPWGSGGYSRANTQFKGHKRPPAAPLASRRAPRAQPYLLLRRGGLPRSAGLPGCGHGPRLQAARRLGGRRALGGRTTGPPESSRPADWGLVHTSRSPRLLGPGGRRATGYGRLVLSLKCTEQKRGDAAASRGFCN